MESDLSYRFSSALAAVSRLSFGQLQETVAFFTDALVVHVITHYTVVTILAKVKCTQYKQWFFAPSHTLCPTTQRNANAGAILDAAPKLRTALEPLNLAIAAAVSSV